MTLPVFSYAYYLSPWAAAPPGFAFLGVYAYVTAAAGQTAGPCTAGRLRQGNTTLQSTISNNPNSVLIVPTAPLSATLDYYLDVQWVASTSTQPNWTAGTYVTTPVVTAVATGLDGSISGSNLTMSWTFGAAALVPTGANLNAYTSTGTGAGSTSVAGTSGTLALNNKAGPGSVLYVQAVMPISGTPDSGFTAPFTMGPVISSLALPLAMPTITSVSYDGGRVHVGWTPPAAPAGSGSISYDLVVTSGTSTSYFAAGANGGMAVIDSGLSESTAFSVAGRVRIGPIIGAPGTSTALITSMPVVDNVMIAGTSVTATVAFPSDAPVGAAATVRLLENGRGKGDTTVSSSGGTATLANFSGGDGWTVQAQMTATVSDTTVTGPWSDPVPVLVAAPVIRAIDMSANPASTNSWIVTVEAASPPPDGSTLNIALSQGATAVASQSVANGSTARFTLAQGTAAANTIDGNSVATATLTIAGPRGTSPSVQASFVGAAPTIAALQNIGAGDPTGATQGIHATLSQAPSASQVPMMRLLANGAVFATANGAASNVAITLPLTQPLNPAIGWTVQARLTGNGVTADTFGGWSAPVAVLTATTSLISADFDAGQLALAIQTPQGVSPTGSAYLFAYASGQAIKGTTVTGTRGSFAVSPASAAWAAGAKPSQPLPGGGGSFAPSSSTVPLLLAAPALSSISYDGATLSAAWSLVNDVANNPATGAMLRVANADGTTSTTTVGSISGEVALLIPASAQGSATVAVRATRTSATAALSGAWCGAVQPIVAAPSLGTVALNRQGNAVSVALALPAGMPGNTTYQTWLMAGDKIAAGPATATVSGQTGTATFSYAALGVAGLTIIAQAQATTNGVALTGPYSPAVPVLAIAPRIAMVSIATQPGNDTQWQLQGNWLAPSDGASISSYWLDLTNSAGGMVESAGFGGATTGALTFAKSGVDASTIYTLTLLSTSANGSTTPAVTTSVSFASPVFTAVTVGETQLSATWTTASPPAGMSYRLNLIDAATSAVIASITTAATTATMDVAGLRLQAEGSYLLGLTTQLGVVAFDAGSDGTYQTRPALLLAAPLTLAVTTNAATGLATLSWGTVADATGYTVTFSDGRSAASVTDTSYPFTSALALGSNISVTVTAKVTANGVSSTGPASAPLTMPTSAPALVSADYDGTHARGEWQPVAGAIGYVATLLDKNGAVAATAPQTSATSVSFATTLAAASAPFTLVVQAVDAAGTGLPSAALPVFQTAWFVSTTATATAPPNIFPAATMALEPEQITIYLPALGTSTVSVEPVGAFNLTYLGNPDATFPYTLTFAANSDVWTFSNGDDDPLPSIRPQIQADYVNFLKAAQTGGASPWGISVLQQAIARWMPQTFDELHYYSYGLYLTGGNGTGAIDLRQGLVLRVGFADYTNVWSGDTNSWLNGFGGGSPSDFDVADFISGSNEWQLSMDAFVARLTSSGAMNVSAPSTLVSASSSAGVADAADLFFPTFPNPFYRLFFPGTLQNPTSTGSVSTAANFALASAADYTALTTTSPTAGQTGNVVYFRGRAVLRLMIRVRVNNMELVVPLGTTVGNILDRYMARPPATSVQLTGVVLERAAGPGIPVFGANPATPPSVYDAAARYMVRLDWSTMATYGGPVDATNLPLIHGDRIAF
ncbi:beta strand repeat-containing protein [Sphingomonas sp.]|jgi:hypothetical protein|uniref:beta strand repeat-containing protein n=1 Tax=Sphingomonas sp. TaxID=28214 RepID=UPI00356A2103